MSSFNALERRRRRRPGQRLFAIPEPRAIEREYANSLRREVLAPLQLIVERELLSNLTELGLRAGLRTDAKSWREDRVTVEVSKRLGDVRLAYARIVRDLDPEQLAFRFAVQEQNHHSRGFRRQMMEVLRVDPTQSEPWLVPLLRQHTRENVSLIKSLGDQTLAEIQDVVLRRFDEGARVESIAQEIERRFEVNSNRAELIAVDQVGKLHGQLTLERQTGLGIRRYRWRSARDERVRGNPTGLYPHARHSHWAREGQIFRWDKPPPDGHPGEAIRCRCYAEPVFEGPLAQVETRARAPRRPQPRAPLPVREQPLRRHPLRQQLRASYVNDETAPREPFERERFERSLDPIREIAQGGRIELTDEEQIAIRRELNTLLAEEGLVSSDIAYGHPRRGQIRVAFDGPGVRASHDFRGRIHVSPGVARELASGDEVQRMMAIRTMVHETTHAHSPISPLAYQGVGRVLEEASVEITARHVMLKRFGTAQYAQGDPWTVPGSYQPYVDALREGVVEMLGGIDQDAATARTLQAVLSMRSYVGEPFGDPFAYLEHFVSQFPEAQDRFHPMLAALNRVLRRFRG